MTSSARAGHPLTDLFSGQSYDPSPVRRTTFHEKSNPFFLCKIFTPPFAKLTVCCRFFDFYSIASRRSLCNTRVTDTCGQQTSQTMLGRRICKERKG